MKKYIENMIGRWEDNTVLDIHKEFTKLTLDIVCKIFFNYEIELDSEVVSNHVTTVIEYFNRVRMPLARLIEPLPLTSNKHFRSAKKQLDEIICHIINDHKPAVVDSTTELGHINNSSPGDLVSDLLASRKADPGSGKVFISDLLLKDNIMTIFLAGHETVANALTWTFYLLSQSKEIEDKLHNEVDSVPGENAHTNDANMSKLQFTEKVFAESMRLYPPAWAVGRQAINDCKIGSYLIPAGSTILMSQYLTHRDPRFFTEPHRFSPERWTNELKAKLPRFSYFPFGGGPRSCIGEKFAWMEGILAISTISRRWRMDLEPSHLVVPQPLVTLRPKYGMLMRLIKRT
jgi:cytochrome P450